MNQVERITNTLRNGFLIIKLLIVGLIVFESATWLWEWLKIDFYGTRAIAHITEVEIKLEEGGPEGHERLFSEASISYEFTIDRKNYFGYGTIAEGDERFGSIAKDAQITIEYESGSPSNNRIYSHHKRGMLVYSLLAAFVLFIASIPITYALSLIKKLINRDS